MLYKFTIAYFSTDNSCCTQGFTVFYFTLGVGNINPSIFSIFRMNGNIEHTSLTFCINSRSSFDGSFGFIFINMVQSTISVCDEVSHIRKLLETPRTG